LPSGGHKFLVRRNLGTRRQRVAALASITAAEQGMVTDAAHEGAVRVLSIGTNFTTAVREFGVRHMLCPSRSPNHNAVVERFQGIVLHEFCRPFLHRGYVSDMATFDQALQRFIHAYNTERPNHSDYMQGATPAPKTRHTPQPLTGNPPKAICHLNL
jgi:hypothetical protein